MNERTPKTLFLCHTIDDINKEDHTKSTDNKDIKHYDNNKYYNLCDV